MEDIVFLVDRIDIRTRKSDDAVIIVMETGEYEVDNIAELFKLSKDVVYKITVEEEDDK